MRTPFLVLLTLALFAITARAETTPDGAETAPPEPRVYVKRVKMDFPKAYQRVFTGLENNGYFVILEPNMGKNLAHFAQRWGENYNRNKLEQFRSIVFCNGWYANEIGNKDPNMLALCPLHLTLIHKEGTTSVLFVRPSQVSANSPAKAVATELEQDVVRVIEEALSR